jgi:hypothetical protein
MLDGLELIAYVIGFWAFLFSARYRANALNTWQEAGGLKRSYLALESVMATVIGFGVPVLIIWVIFLR